MIAIRAARAQSHYALAARTAIMQLRHLAASAQTG
jgi:hypothetical protein